MSADKTTEPPKKRPAKPRKKPAATAHSKPTTAESVTPGLSLEQLRAYVRANCGQLLQDPNVTSVGIGYKQVAGQATPQLAIQFTVTNKVIPQSIEALGSQPIPAWLEVAGCQVPTDVLERSFSPGYKRVDLTPKDPRKVRADVVQPGMSIGSVLISAGSIGAFVRDRSSGATVVLSNWHVLQGPGGFIGNEVVQPGPYDDNQTERNRFGLLLRSHLGAAGDCAIASIDGRTIDLKVLDLGVAIGAIGDPELGDRVIKSARTTAVTQGIVSRIEVNTKLSYGGGVEATIGGFEIAPDPAAPAADGQISKGGDSGAAWLAVDAQGHASDVMLGLHFGGDADDGSHEFALACYAQSVMTALNVEPLPAGEPQTVATAPANTTLAQGFDSAFLPFALPIPSFTAPRRKDLASLDGDTQLRYCHFSVWLSEARKYALCVAWNIDGNTFKHFTRGSFRLDQRGDLAKYQLGSDLYANNPFDKGHIARRTDLCWGAPEEARQAHFDSFYFTNITPQHKAFNESTDREADPQGGLWGRLENSIFDGEKPADLKVSVLAGPVFGADDGKFVQGKIECLVPNEFWKVVAYHDESDSKDKVYAFLLTQKNLVENLTVAQNLDLEPWLWARIGLRDLENKTGVIFATELHAREIDFSVPQEVSDGPALRLITGDDYFK